jgi:hypothetical protein
VSWLDARVGRLIYGVLGVIFLILDWTDGTISPFGLLFIGGAIPRSPLVRIHVWVLGWTVIGLCLFGLGISSGDSVRIAVGVAWVLFAMGSEVMVLRSTRPKYRLSEHLVAAIRKEPAQLARAPSYNFRLANGDVVYWPVIGGAYLSRRHRRHRLDFSPKDVVDIERVPRERLW